MRFSIITITYNSAATLEETIRSVAAQNFKDYEYLIIDGGSTDGTLDMVKKYPNVVTKWISEPDRGISDAFNKGIRMAKGEIVCIINSDDKLGKNALQLISDNIKDDTDIFYGNAIMFGGNEKSYRMYPDSSLEILRERMALIHPATFVRKNAYERYGLFDLKYKCQMDRELLLRMYVKGAKFQYLNADLAEMRLGGVNQRTYLKVTVPEGEEISIKYGVPPTRAKIVSIKRKLRFVVAANVRKLPFSTMIRKRFHSKNCELDI